MYVFNSQHNIKQRVEEEPFGSDGYIYCIDFGGCFIDVYLFSNSSSCLC